MGFRGRQVIAMTGVATIVALVTTVASVAVMVRSSVDRIREEARLIARTVYERAGTVVRDHWSTGYEAALGTDPALRDIADAVVGYSPLFVYVSIVDADDRVLFHTDPDRQGRIEAPDAPFDRFSERNPLVQTWTLASESRVFSLGIPVRTEKEGTIAVVRVGISTVLIRNRLSGMIAWGAAVTVGLVLCAFLVSVVAADRILGPVDRLREELARVDLGGRRLDLRTSADADRIASLFGSMAKELEKRAREAERRTGPPVPVVESGWILVEDGAIADLDGRAARMLGIACGDAPQRLGDDHPLRTLASEALASGGPIGPRRLGIVEGDLAAAGVAHAWPLAVDGRKVLVTLRDGRAIARLGEELTRSRKLEALGRLSSGVTHEIKNALNGMMMHVEVLRRKTEPDASSVRSIEVVDRELRRLDRVLTTFLGFLRPETVEFEEIDLAAVVRDAADSIAARCEVGGIRLSVDVPREGLVVRANADMLHEALTNLLHNACDAMPRGGPLRISASPGSGSGATVVEVEDGGEGIPPERLSRIFDLFFTTKSGGTGLGLSTVFRIVHVHGGRVDVESEPGRGTRFAIRLPEA